MLKDLFVRLKLVKNKNISSIYRMSQSTCIISHEVIERIEMNKQVPYRFNTVILINNKLLINKNPRIHARSRNSARRDGSLLLLYARRDLERIVI